MLHEASIDYFIDENSVGKVARDGDLQEHTWKHLYFDLVDHDKVRSFRIKKQAPFALFKLTFMGRCAKTRKVTNKNGSWHNSYVKTSVAIPVCLLSLAHSCF